MINHLSECRVGVKALIGKIHADKTGNDDRETGNFTLGKKNGKKIFKNERSESMKACILRRELSPSHNCVMNK